VVLLKTTYKSFFGTSANAVRTQIWIAVSTYLLVAIVRKRFGTAGESLPNSTDSQRHAFRESAHFTGSGSTIFPGRLTRRPQAVDSVQLLTGHSCCIFFAGSSGITCSNQPSLPIRQRFATTMLARYTSRRRMRLRWAVRPASLGLALRERLINGQL
jgi:hypothetical protein